MEQQPQLCSDSGRNLKPCKQAGRRTGHRRHLLIRPFESDKILSPPPLPSRDLPHFAISRAAFERGECFLNQQNTKQRTTVCLSGPCQCPDVLYEMKRGSGRGVLWSFPAEQRDSLEMRFCVGVVNHQSPLQDATRKTRDSFSRQTTVTAAIKGILQENTDLYVWECKLIKNNKHPAKKNEYACGLGFFTFARNKEQILTCYNSPRLSIMKPISRQTLHFTNYFLLINFTVYSNDNL